MLDGVAALRASHVSAVGLHGSHYSAGSSAGTLPPRHQSRLSECDSTEGHLHPELHAAGLVRLHHGCCREVQSGHSTGVGVHGTCGEPGTGCAVLSHESMPASDIPAAALHPCCDSGGRSLSACRSRRGAGVAYRRHLPGWLLSDTARYLHRYLYRVVPYLRSHLWRHVPDVRSHLPRHVRGNLRGDLRANVRRDLRSDLCPHLRSYVPGFVRHMLPNVLRDLRCNLPGLLPFLRRDLHCDVYPGMRAYRTQHLHHLSRAQLPIAAGPSGRGGRTSLPHANFLPPSCHLRRRDLCVGSHVPRDLRRYLCAVVPHLHPYVCRYLRGNVRSVVPYLCADMRRDLCGHMCRHLHPHLRGYVRGDLCAVVPHLRCDVCRHLRRHVPPQLRAIVPADGTRNLCDLHSTSLPASAGDGSGGTDSASADRGLVPRGLYDRGRLSHARGHLRGDLWCDVSGDLFPHLCRHVRGNLRGNLRRHLCGHMSHLHAHVRRDLRRNLRAFLSYLYTYLRTDVRRQLPAFVPLYLRSGLRADHSRHMRDLPDSALPAANGPWSRSAPGNPSDVRHVPANRLSHYLRSYLFAHGLCQYLRSYLQSRTLRDAGTHRVPDLRRADGPVQHARRLSDSDGGRLSGPHGCGVPGSDGRRMSGPHPGQLSDSNGGRLSGPHGCGLSGSDGRRVSGPHPGELSDSNGGRLSGPHSCGVPRSDGGRVSRPHSARMPGADHQLPDPIGSVSQPRVPVDRLRRRTGRWRRRVMAERR